RRELRVGAGRVVELKSGPGHGQPVDLPHAVEQQLDALALAVAGVRLADQVRDELRRHPADRGLYERSLGREIVLLGALADAGTLRYPTRGQRGVAVLDQRLDRRIQQRGLGRGATVGLAATPSRRGAHEPSVPTTDAVRESEDLSSHLTCKVSAGMRRWADA